MSKRKRTLISLGVATVLCGTYLWFFGVQTFMALEARNVARNTPVVRRIPVELPDLSISRTPGKKLSYFGYEFEVPWDDIDQAKSRIVGANRAIIAFRSGNALSVWSGSPHEFVNTTLSSGKINRDTFRKIYGDAALESDYSFQRIILEATPNKITPLMPKELAISQAMLLVMKAISLPSGADSGIFAVTTGEFHGFQFGQPQSSPRGINVELYSDNASLAFIFSKKLNGPIVITQPDINRVLQTIHKISAETAASLEIPALRRP
jgi:hypothetical protein